MHLFCFVLFCCCSCCFVCFLSIFGPYCGFQRLEARNGRLETDRWPKSLRTRGKRLNRAWFHSNRRKTAEWSFIPVTSYHSSNKQNKQIWGEHNTDYAIYCLRSYFIDNKTLWRGNRDVKTINSPREQIREKQCQSPRWQSTKTKKTDTSHHVARCVTRLGNMPISRGRCGGCVFCSQEKVRKSEGMIKYFVYSYMVKDHQLWCHSFGPDCCAKSLKFTAGAHANGQGCKKHLKTSGSFLNSLCSEELFGALHDWMRFTEDGEHEKSLRKGRGNDCNKPSLILRCFLYNRAENKMEDILCFPFTANLESDFDGQVWKLYPQINLSSYTYNYCIKVTEGGLTAGGWLRICWKLGFACLYVCTLYVVYFFGTPYATNTMETSFLRRPQIAKEYWRLHRSHHDICMYCSGIKRR